jgi:hypothetical protein
MATRGGSLVRSFNSRALLSTPRMATRAEEIEKKRWGWAGKGRKDGLDG